MNTSFLSQVLFPFIFGRRVDRTDGGRLDHIADGESLDGLVLGSASRAVGASDRLDVATALLVTSAVQKQSVLSSV